MDTQYKSSVRSAKGTVITDVNNFALLVLSSFSMLIVLTLIAGFALYLLAMFNPQFRAVLAMLALIAGIGLLISSFIINESRIMHMSRSGINNSKFAIVAVFALMFGFLFTLAPPSIFIPALLMTVASFCIAAIYGYTTNRSMGNVAGIAAVAILVAVVVGFINIFMHSNALSIIISLAIIPISLIFIAYDMQRVRSESFYIYSSMIDQDVHPSLAFERIAFSHSFSLIISFYNLFSAILRILIALNSRD